MSRHTAVPSFIKAPRNLRLGALVLVFVAINQIDDALVGATVIEELLYWTVRLSALVGGLWAADAIVSRIDGERYSKPEWLRPVVFVTALGLLPFAFAEVLVEPHLPMRPEYSDDDLRAYSMMLVYLAEYVTILSIILPVHLVLWLILERTPAAAGRAEPVATVEPSFLARTSAASAEAVLALQADEHYIQVITATEKEMIHHRFRDAVSEMPSEMGLQVHRSWWVADSAVRSAARGSRRWQLSLVTGDLVPVSDSYVAAVRERGLLKRRTRS